jgi:hypothetical protein
LLLLLALPVFFVILILLVLISFLVFLVLLVLLALLGLLLDALAIVGKPLPSVLVPNLARIALFLGTLALVTTVDEVAGAC